MECIGDKISKWKWWPSVLFITWIILIFSGNFGEIERTEARVETRDPGSESRTRGLQEGTQVKQADNR